MKPSPDPYRAVPQRFVRQNTFFGVETHELPDFDMDRFSVSEVDGQRIISGTIGNIFYEGDRLRHGAILFEVYESYSHVHGTMTMNGCRFRAREIPKSP